MPHGAILMRDFGRYNVQISAPEFGGRRLGDAEDESELPNDHIGGGTCH